MQKDLSFIRSAAALIFDMDGLLLDTESMSLRAWQRAVGTRGLEIDSVYHQLIGRGTIECDRILAEHFGEGVAVHELRADKDAFFDNMLKEGVALRPGCAELLGILQAIGTSTALATSATRLEATRKLAAARLDHRFEVQVFRDDVGRSKPAPDLFMKASERLGVAPAQCVVFEDSHAGVEAALAAGMRAVMIPDLLPPAPWVVERGVTIVESLEAIAALFGKATR